SARKHDRAGLNRLPVGERDRLEPGRFIMGETDSANSKLRFRANPFRLRIEGFREIPPRGPNRKSRVVLNTTGILRLPPDFLLRVDKKRIEPVRSTHNRRC